MQNNVKHTQSIKMCSTRHHTTKRTVISKLNNELMV